jgi:endonuclease YncB( thermonuclease family)
MEKRVLQVGGSEWNQLKNSNMSIPEFSLDGRTTIGKVVNIYDGDTCKLCLFLDKEYKNLSRYNIRMNGYDCPEMKTKNLLEKRYAQFSKECFEKLVGNKLVKVYCKEFDKYGRLLGEIYVMQPNGQELHINQWMISNKLGYGYEGGTKSGFTAHWGDISHEEMRKIVSVPETCDWNKNHEE